MLRAPATPTRISGFVGVLLIVIIAHGWARYIISHQGSDDVVTTRDSGDDKDRWPVQPDVENLARSSSPSTSSDTLGELRLSASVLRSGSRVSLAQVGRPPIKSPSKDPEPDEPVDPDRLRNSTPSAQSASITGLLESGPVAVTLISEHLSCTPGMAVCLPPEDAPRTRGPPPTT